MKIEIKGLEVKACHGVLKEEKTNPRPFLFDIVMEAAVEKSTASDDVSDTVNYAEVCAAVDGFCRNNTFNLIERLAYGAARLIVEKFPAVNGVSVTVHKPQAPIGLPFADVSVTAEVERNKVVLSLGSSTGDRQSILNGAIEELKKTDGVKVLKVSGFHETEPYGGVAVNMFLNCAVLLECVLSPDGLLEILHKIEADFGRVRDKRWGDRTLDLDIIFFGNKVIAREGLCVPHPDYENRAFVTEPLKEIAPDFVCPKTFKRVSDM